MSLVLALVLCFELVPLGLALQQLAVPHTQHPRHEAHPQVHAGMPLAVAAAGMQRDDGQATGHRQQQGQALQRPCPASALGYACAAVAGSGVTLHYTMVNGTATAPPPNYCTGASPPPRAHTADTDAAGGGVLHMAVEAQTAGTCRCRCGCRCRCAG